MAINASDIIPIFLLVSVVSNWYGTKILYNLRGGPTGRDEIL